MKFRNYLFLSVALLAAISCVKEVEQEVETIEPGQEEVAVQPVQNKLPGLAAVKFSSETADQLDAELRESGLPVTRSAAFSSVIKGLGIVSMERIFPYDAKYEERARREGLHQWYQIRFDRNLPLTKASSDLSALPGVDEVESMPRLAVHRFNDPDYGKQWHFYNDGLSGGLAGFDINVEPVWKYYTKGNPKVVVAVIDEGVDLSHDDLKWNTLPGGQNGSKNFYDNSFIIDPGDHGTHVAGVIAGVNNNGTGICGIAGGDYKARQKGVRIMSCEMLGRDNENANAAAAFRWAADNGAVIAQNSWGYPADSNMDGMLSQAEKDAAHASTIPHYLKTAIDYFIKYAGCDNYGNQLPDSPMKGGVVFFAAGNDAFDYDPICDYEPVIAVGSVNAKGKRSDFSNYGPWVDIAAPGSNIFSTVVGGFGSMSGTSMACPHASGVAALVLSYRGGTGFTNDMLKEAILKGANSEILPASEKVGPMLDALGAITYGSKDLPEQPEYTTAVSSNNVDFTWKLTGNSRNIPAQIHMMVAAPTREQLENIDLNHLPEGVFATNIVTPDDAKVGKLMQGRLTGMDFHKDYQVALVAMNYTRSYSKDYHLTAVSTLENNPPELVSETDRFLQIKCFEEKVIPFQIKDPDGHQVVLETDPLDGDFDIEELDGNGNYLLTIHAVSFEPGTYHLNMHIKDQYGMQTEESLNFEILPNRAPEKVKDFQGIISQKPGDKYEFLLSDYLVDPDGENLNVEFEVSDKGVLHVNLSEGRLYLTLLSYGLSEVKIKATDIKGMSVESSFKVLVRKNDVFVELYPIPMKKDLFIRTGQNLEDTRVKIISANGSVLYDRNQPCSAFEPMKIDVSHLAPGSYQVEVSYGGQSESRKVVKR